MKCEEVYSKSMVKGEQNPKIDFSSFEHIAIGEQI